MEHWCNVLFGDDDGERLRALVRAAGIDGCLFGRSVLDEPKPPGDEIERLAREAS